MKQVIRVDTSSPRHEEQTPKEDRNLGLKVLVGSVALVALAPAASNAINFVKDKASAVFSDDAENPIVQEEMQTHTTVPAKGDTLWGYAEDLNPDGTLDNRDIVKQIQELNPGLAERGLRYDDPKIILPGPSPIDPSQNN